LALLSDGAARRACRRLVCFAGGWDASRSCCQASLRAGSIGPRRFHRNQATMLPAIDTNEKAMPASQSSLCM
jgi:hypothetical protein